MLETLKIRKKYRSSDLMNVLNFIQKYSDSDFYLTSDNKRFSVTTTQLLKKLLSESLVTFVDKNEDNDITGLVLVWKSNGENTRYYIKLVADSPKTAARLLTQINWNVEPVLYMKIAKHSKFVNTFQSKGFRFFGGRGSQILLRRDKTIIPKLTFQREEEDE